MFLLFCFRILGLFLLLLIVVENGRHVLPAAPSCWVVIFPEEIEKIAECDDFRIIIKLNCFGVIPSAKIISTIIV